MHVRAKESQNENLTNNPQ